MENLWKPKNRNQKRFATALVWIVFFMIISNTDTNRIINFFLATVSIGLTLYIWVSQSNDYDDSLDIIAEEKRIKKLNNKKAQKEKLGYQTSFATLHYYGGGKISKEKDIQVVVTSTGLKYDKYFIPIEAISSANIETQSQIKSRLTVTRMLAFGVFSLAAPKRTKSTEKFLSIEYNEGFSNLLILGGKNVTKIQSALAMVKNSSMSKSKEAQS